MPKIFIYLGLTLIMLAMIPPALIMRARTRPRDSRRIHFIQDMDNQASYKSQSENDLFADRRAMRPPVPGTIARGAVINDDHYLHGVGEGGWMTGYPDRISVDLAFVERGRERFAIYCTPCHGEDGYGNGIINQRAMELMNNPAMSNGTAWVNPKNIHEPEIRAQPVGQIFNTITHGIRNMAGYGAQIPVDDRWAITAYVKALQRSQNAQPGDLPDGSTIDELPFIDLMPPPEEDAGQ